MEEIVKRLKLLEEMLQEQNLLRKEVLTVEEAVKYMGISKPTLYKLTSEHKIPFYKPTEGKNYFKRTELNEWLLSNKQLSDREVESSAVRFLSSKTRRAV